MVILITGKKGSGKSTYAQRLKAEMEAEAYRVIWLDGDLFRKEMKNDDYTDEGRLRNLRDAAKAAADYERLGYTVLLSFIAPKKSFRKMMRSYWEVSRVVYMPGGTLWEGTTYERPSEREIEVKHNHKK